MENQSSVWEGDAGPDLRVDLAGQLQSALVGSVSDTVLLHGVTDQAQAPRFATVHHPGGEDELLGQRGVDEPGKALCTPCTEKGRSFSCERTERYETMTAPRAANKQKQRQIHLK